MALITGTPLDDILNGTNKADTIYGLAGNDLIHGLQGDDKVVGEQESLIYSNIAGVVTIPASVIFGGDFLFGDQGQDKLYGDLVTLAFVVEAGPEVTQTFGGFTVILGDDVLDGGVGQDLLVGDVDTILLRAKATLVSAAAPTGNADAILQNISMTMGVDILYGGEGIDNIYGDVRNMTLESIAGTANDPTTGAQTANARIQLITFQGGVDHLYGGNGDDFLYGDIGTLNLLAHAGNSFGTGDQANAFIRPLTPADTSILTMGGDFLYGDNGNDTLYGDIGTLSLKAGDLNGILVNRGGNNIVLSNSTELQPGDVLIPDGSGTVNGGALAVGEIRNITFNMGVDELHGGLGDDKLYGDVGTLSLFGQGGQALSPGAIATGQIQPVTTIPETFPVRFNMGVDHLYGEEGNDHLVGDIGTLTIQGIAGLTTAGSFSNGQAKGTFFMGGDTLDGGKGDDFLYGDVENLSIIAQGGTVSGTGVQAASTVGAPLTMGADTLIGGEGKDHLYGDVGAFTVSYTGGTITSTSTNLINADTLAGTGGPFPIVINGGIDNLVGGSGDDFLYGDVGTLSILMTGGTNAVLSTYLFSATASLFNSTFAMGNDTLDGGSGNDQLYGDLGTFSMILTPGSGSGTTPGVNNTKIQFGNDILIGGQGDDTLVGDIADPAQLNEFLNAPFFIHPFLPLTTNQIIFGNDTFQFSLGGSNGNDVVKDMNIGAVSTAFTNVTNVMDTLKFTDVLNVNGGALDYTDVDAQSVFSNSGGHLKVSFAGGSVLFENISWASQDSVTDITPNIVVI